VPTGSALDKLGADPKFCGTYGRESRTRLIAYDLNMCESTVKVHIRHILKKLNAHNRTQVVLLTRSMNVNGAAVTNG
jgi:hypothetical protein